MQKLTFPRFSAQGSVSPYDATGIVQHTVDPPYMVDSTHFYSFEKNDQLILFDCGPSLPQQPLWIKKHIDVERISHIFITHCHLDHAGCLPYLARTSSAKIYLPARDKLKLTNWSRRVHGLRSLIAELGFKGEQLRHMQALFSDTQDLPLPPDTFAVVEEEMPTELGINFTACPGHTQSDLVYFTRDWAITGDMLLRNIFQVPLLDIDLETGLPFDNYRAYCQSFVKLHGLRDRKIYPGHREDIPHVEDALLFYISKLLQRVSRLQKHDTSLPVGEIIHEIFAERISNPFHLYLKTSEIIFFQKFLENPELLAEALKATSLYENIKVKFEKTVN